MSPVLRVSEAARTGDVPELKRVLDGVSIPKRDFLLKTRTDGATPLITAARNGNTAIVQCLLDEYDVDMEQEGTVKIDGDLIECCTPLWMASLGGHLAIVRLLLERGAEVNHTTLTNSTPLRAASFNGHTEVGTANKHVKHKVINIVCRRRCGLVVTGCGTCNLEVLGSNLIVTTLFCFQIYGHAM